jgi:hypothetical protein
MVSEETSSNGAGMPEDRLTDARLGLLNMYSLQTTTHGGLLVSSALLLVTWLEFASRVNTVLWAIVGSGVITAMTYLLMRTLYWGYLATKVINLGYFIRNEKIDFEALNKLVLDDRAKGALKVIEQQDDLLLQAYRLAGPTFISPDEGGFLLNLIHKTHTQRTYLYAVLGTSFLIPCILLVGFS